MHAYNVHQGGGKSLLLALLEAIPDDIIAFAQLDKRMVLSNHVPKTLTVKFVAPTVLNRLREEWQLAQHVKPLDRILCFGNLPPLFKLRGHTVVFMQNRYLVDDVGLGGFPLGMRLRLTMERLWFSKKVLNADEFIVQTPTMKRLLEIKTQGTVPIRVLPFVAEPNGYRRNAVPTEANKKSLYDFLYVASGEPHKNHPRLIEAWRLLAEEGLFPSLCLTLDEIRFAGLCHEIDHVRQQHGLKVVNVGNQSHQEVLALYNESAAVIYPSTFESFGLPLIEARQAKLPILASELDYVRDVLDPEQTFDPESPVSIARAVKRFMNIDEQPLLLLDAQSFLKHIVSKAG